MWNAKRKRKTERKEWSSSRLFLRSWFSDPHFPFQVTSSFKKFPFPSHGVSPMSKPSRREFLKPSVAVAGVAASVGSASAFVAGNETIKVGLIGCGGRGTGAVRDILNAEEKINGENPKI